MTFEKGWAEKGGLEQGAKDRAEYTDVRQLAEFNNHAPEESQSKRYTRAQRDYRFRQCRMGVDEALRE